MQTLGPAPQALSPEEIIAKWGDADGPLDQMVKECRDPQHEFERLVQIRQSHYNWRMVAGDQFVAPGFTSDWTGQELVDFVSVDSLPDPDQNGAQVAMSYPFNVVGGDCYKYVAVMGQSAPRVKAVADDPTSNESLRMSKDADAVLRDAWIKLKVDRGWRIIAFHQYTTGPAYIHTPFVVDGQKYGQEVVPRVGIQMSDDGIPAPQEGQPEVYANGDAEWRVYSIFEVSHPYGTKDLSDNGWLILEYMQNKFKLLKEYKQLEKYRTGDVPDNEMGASVVAANTARDSVSNPSGVGRPKKTNEWRVREVWVRPYMLEAIQDANCRQVLQTQFPNGLYICKVGDITVDLADRPMDDEWSVVKTGRGEKIIEKPIAHDSVPMQRAINDLLNLAVETVLRAITKTIVDQMLFDRKSVSQNEALPAELVFTTTPLGTDISKMIAQIPPARVSDQLVPLFQAIRALQQDVTGIRPELSGGGQPTQTFREAKQRKEQALAQLSPQAAEMQAGAEAAARNVVKQRAKYGAGTIKSPRKTRFGPKMDVVELAALSNDGWHCEADDNFPITTADTFDKLWGLLKEFPPEVQQALSLLDPMNLQRNLELLQLPGYESAFEDQVLKTLDDIDQLLKAMPIPGPDGQMQPSIQPDQYDDHAFVADFVRKWMVSQEGREAKAQNPDTFSNVEAFQNAQQQMANPPAPPPPPLVRTSLNVAAKLEDMGPDFTREITQGAGLPGNAQPPAPQPEAPQPEGGETELPTPAPAEAQQEPAGSTEALPPGPIAQPQGPEPIKPPNFIQ